MVLNGSCLCGKTTLKISIDKPSSQIICHCTDCQQSSGSAFSTNILAPQSEVQISGSVAEYNMKVPSGNTVTRVFCKECGSPISHKSKAFGDKQAIQTGILYKDFTPVPVDTELFSK